MSNATALTRRATPANPTPAVVAAQSADLDVMQLGQVLARSGYFKDARDASQAVVKVLFGREIGIGPVSAMMGIHIIEGKPAPSANLIAARLKASGRYDYRVREHTAEVCRIEFFERSAAGRESLGLVEWTMKDAQRAGLGGRGPWKSYPRAMLFARAISEGARVHAPELFGGAPVYTPEELGADVDEDGNPLGVVAPEPVRYAEPEAVQDATEEQLRDIDRFGLDPHITEDERTKLGRRIARGMSHEEAEAAIQWLTEEIEARTALEMDEAMAVDHEVA